MDRLRYWHARVVLTLDDEHRYIDLVDVVHRANALEVCAHLRITLVAVLHPPKIASVVLGVFEKGHEARDSYDVHRCLETIAVVYRAGQHHVAAVAAAEHGNAISVEVGLRSDPVEQCTYIAHRVFALKAIV